MIIYCTAQVCKAFTYQWEIQLYSMQYHPFPYVPTKIFMVTKGFQSTKVFSQGFQFPLMETHTQKTIKVARKLKFNGF